MNSYYDNPIMNKSSSHEQIGFAIQYVGSDTKKILFCNDRKGRRTLIFRLKKLQYLQELGNSKMSCE